MEIKNSFSVPVPPQQAWELLLDVPRIVPCLPGASLEEQIGAYHYRGAATIKVGPVQLRFKGDAEIKEVDAAAMRAEVIAKGADAKGRGNANSVTVFEVVEEDGASRVELSTDLQLVGAVAQYGRASGLIGEIANQLVAQFAENLRQGIASEVNGADLGAHSDARPNPNREISAISLVGGAMKAKVAKWVSSEKEGK